MSNIVATIRRTAVELIKATALALVMVAALKSAVVEANQIVSGSMTPTLREGDYILVNKARYGLRLPFVGTPLYAWDAPRRGDVVTFTPPAVIRDAAGRLFIKRVVAVAGDVVTGAEGRLWVNGRQAAAGPAEATSPHGWSLTLAGTVPDFGPIVVADGFVYVVGDNRGNSHDSRTWGPLPVGNVEGKAVLIYYPAAGADGFGRIGALL